jgi:cardiolipin synthase
LWDSNNIVISSLNWSSADARDDMPFGEVGVRVRSPGIATHLSKRILDVAMSEK